MSTWTLLFISPFNTKQQQHILMSKRTTRMQQQTTTTTAIDKLPLPKNLKSTTSETITASATLVKHHDRRALLQNAAAFVIPASLVFLSSSSPSHAISSQEAESSYNQYAPTYDTLDGGSVADSLGIEQARSKMLQLATGKVLEIGAGTGLNLGKYKFASSPGAMDGVTSLTLLDISQGMMAEAKAKLLSLEIPDFVEVTFVKADATKDLIHLFSVSAESTDTNDGGYFDTVVDTFSLCVMGDTGAKQCLAQMTNVVKRDTGRLLLIENARSSNPALGFYQDLTSESAAKMGGKGCVSNQNVGGFIRGADGLELLSEELFAAGLFRSFVCRRRI
jgi:methyltransferase OMS1